MEVYLNIEFDGLSEHWPHWEAVCELLADHKLGWPLQEALDPISVEAADKLESVWEQLPSGNESFEVHVATFKKGHCHLKLMTGDMVIDTLTQAFKAWFEYCPVNHLTLKVTGDGD